MTDAKKTGKGQEKSGEVKTKGERIVMFFRHDAAIVTVLRIKK
jgi:hypothetical protein